MRPFWLIFFLFTAPFGALQASAQHVPQSRAQMQLSFVPAVREAAPAVVNVYARIMAAPLIGMRQGGVVLLVNAGQIIRPKYALAASPRQDQRIRMVVQRGDQCTTLRLRV